MGGKGSGRKPKYDDPWHEMIRRNQRKYWKKHRDAILLGMKLKISVAEARKRLGIKFEPKKTHGKLKSQSELPLGEQGNSPKHHEA